MQTRRRALTLPIVTAAAAGLFFAPCFRAAAQAAPEKEAVTPEDHPAERPAEKPSENPEPASVPGPPGIEDLVEKAQSSVVTVSHSGRGGRQAGLGTGFIISTDGLIATNLHVIGEARPIEVELADGTTHPVQEIHAWDRKLDLAIIRVEAKDLDLQPLTLGDSDTLKQGAEVIALGNPQGLKYSVVKGIVSAIRSLEEGESAALIQVAIPVEPGNSGGPLLDRDGAVRGIITFKSAVSENLGFAMPVNAIKLLVEKPNPVPMSRWLTIGALDPARWRPLMGARWSQWAGVIYAADYGAGFGGRSLCLYQPDKPAIPYEIAVDVRLDDESGAAGLAFASDGGEVHYGFYPSAGNLRLTRFNGADVYSWTVLEEKPAPAYRPGEWNQLRVRVEKDRLLCYVNDEMVIESTDAVLREGSVGLCKFRDTRPEFRLFRVGADLATPAVPGEVLGRLTDAITEFANAGTKTDALVDTLLEHPQAGQRMLLEKAKKLQDNARQLEALATELHHRDTAAELVAALSAEESEIDLFHAGLLVARLDNPQLDVQAYLEELDRMAKEIHDRIPGDAGAADRIEALNRYLFEENGFHGSRTEYYTHSNSYLNEVLDDHEGIPITLAILYMELAERVGLDHVVGISLPGHFILQHRPKEGKRPFIDVFEGGTLLSRREAEELAMRFTGQKPLPGDFKPATKKEIILRMLRNLIGLSLDSDTSQAALPYLDAYLAIDGEAAGQRLSRALLRFQKGDHAGARVDLRWILDARPEGMNLSRLRELHDRLE